MERWLTALRRRGADGAAAARRRLALTAALALLTSPALSRAAAAEELRPFTAEYAWSVKGVTAGQSTLTLSRRDDGRWSYASRSTARGLFKLVAPGEITQTSIFRVENGEVLPDHYHGDDGTASTKRDANITFDWRAHRVTGIYEDVKVDLAIENGVQDDLSIQIALLNALLRERLPAGFRLVDRNLLKEYQYTAEGRVTLDTALGALDAVVFRSRKLGAHSSTVFWCAPSLGYLPVKVERHDGADKIDWALTIRSARRD